MFESIKKFFKRNKKKEVTNTSSKDAAKERLHLVLMQDRANVSADFLDLMRKEIIEVIKKYIDIDEKSMDVRLTTETSEDGTNGVPALYANIPILNIKEKNKKIEQEVSLEEKNIEEKSTEEENLKQIEEAKKLKKQLNNELTNEKSLEDENILTDNKVTSLETPKQENKQIEEENNNEE